MYQRLLKFLSFVVLLVMLASASKPLAQPAGGTLTIASSQGLNSLNPLSEEPAASELMPLFLGTLLAVNPLNAQIEPNLAEQPPQVSPDRKTFTITLRTAKFSDGTPFTVDDVLFTFNDVFLNTKVRTRMLDLLRGFLKVDGQPLIQQVERVDERTVRLVLNTPLPTSLLVLLAQIPILPKHKLEKRDVLRSWGVGTKPEEIVGLGPFKVSEFARNRVVFAHNNLYWKRDAQGNQLPRLGRIVWLGEQREILKQFQEGKIDLFEIRAEEAQSLSAQAKLILGGPQKLLISLYINQDVSDAEKRALFQDVCFRQALAHATDRTAFIKKYPGELAVPRESVLHPLSPFYNEASLVRYAFDLAKAAALLDQVGLKDADGDGWRDLPSKKPFKLMLLLHRDDPVRIEVARIYQTNLTKVNLRVELEIVSRGEWGGRLATKPPRYEISLVGDNLEFEMPLFVLQLAGILDITGKTEEINQVLAQLPTAPDAYALFARLQKLLSEDVPVLPLYSPQYLVAVQPSVKNAEIINAYGYVRFLELLQKE